MVDFSLLPSSLGNFLCTEPHWLCASMVNTANLSNTSKKYENATARNVFLKFFFIPL